MSKKSRLPQSRRHVFVYDEDWEFLLAEYGPGTESGLSVGSIIREMVHKRVVAIKDKANQANDAIRAKIVAGQELINDGAEKING